MGEIPGLHDLATLLCPCSPATFVFPALIAIAAYFMSVPDMGQERSWLLLVLFAVLALIPDTEPDE